MKPDTLCAKDLEGLSMLDDKNERIKLSDLWKDKTAVLVFIRHFG